MATGAGIKGTSFSNIMVTPAGKPDYTIDFQLWTDNKNLPDTTSVQIWTSRDFLAYTGTVNLTMKVTDGSYMGYYDASILVQDSSGNVTIDTPQKVLLNEVVCNDSTNPYFFIDPNNRTGSSLNDYDYGSGSPDVWSDIAPTVPIIEITKISTLKEPTEEQVGIGSFKVLISDIGSSEVTECGIECSEDPTFKTIKNTNKIGTVKINEEMSVYISIDNAQNYYRAYAKNSEYTGYSSVKDKTGADAFIPNEMNPEVTFNPTADLLEINYDCHLVDNGFETTDFMFNIIDTTTGDSIGRTYQDSNPTGRLTLDFSGRESLASHEIGLKITAQTINNESVTFTPPNTFHVPDNLFMDIVPSEVITLNHVANNWFYFNSNPWHTIFPFDDVNRFYSVVITLGTNPDTDDAIYQNVKCKDYLISSSGLQLYFGSQQTSNSHVINEDGPSIETGAFSAYDYFLERGQTYNFGVRYTTRYLGVKKQTALSFNQSFYIPFEIKAYHQTDKSMDYRVDKYENGNPYLSFVSFWIKIENPNNENITQKYIISGHEAEINDFEYTEDQHKISAKDLLSYDEYIYKNAELRIPIECKIYFCEEIYNNKVRPISFYLTIVLPPNAITVNMHEYDILYDEDTNKIQFGGDIFRKSNLLDNINFKVIYQISKSSDFSIITHQSEEQVSAGKTSGSILVFKPTFDVTDADIGDNYLRAVAKLSESEGYAVLPDIYSETMTINVPEKPKITEFSVELLSNNSIDILVKGNCQLFVDFYRNSDGTVYNSQNVISGEKVTISDSIYNEPGTTWYVRARSTDGNKTAVLTTVDEDGNENEVEYLIAIPYTYDVNYQTNANPQLTASKVQLNNTANLTFNFNKIETNLPNVIYEIDMYTTNYPIDPLKFLNVQENSFTHTFESRLDDEVLSYKLIVHLRNTLGDLLETFTIDSNEVTLDSVDLDSPSESCTFDKTYHSLGIRDYGIQSNDWKLYRVETSVGSQSRIQGTEEPSLGEEELIPELVTFDNLYPNNQYTFAIKLFFVHPLDLTKKRTCSNNYITHTEQFYYYAPGIHNVNITNQVSGKPTKYSNFELSWDFAPGQSFPTEPCKYFTVEYKKNDETEYTVIETTEKYYTLSASKLNLADNDEIYIRIGAHYLNSYTNQTYHKYYEFPKYIISETSYEYYRCSYPDLEKHQRKMYKMLEGEPSERLIRDIYMDK